MTEDMRDELKVKPGETEDEYEIRICSLHDESDLTWDDITAIINSALDWNYTESRYRKVWKAYCLGVKNTAVQRRPRSKGEGDYLTTKNNPIEIDELKKQPAEPKYTEKEEDLRESYATTSDRLAYFRELRQDSRFERFYKNIAAAIEKVGKLEVPIFLNPVQTKKQDKQYVVGLADLHLGAAFSAINNKYNIEIANKRIEDSANYIKDFVLEKGLSEITVLSLGDMIQGMLRTSDLKLNEKDVVDAFVIAERLLAGFLNSLSKYCKVKFIQVCYSNHEQPRYLGTKANELAGEDMGKILFAYLQDVLALNERVEIIGDTEKDYYEFKIFDFECFAEHGHQIKSIADANKNLTNRHRKFYDYVFLAHSHSTKEFITAEGLHHDVETLVLPSLIGSDPYADKLMVGSKAAIKIFGFDKKYGHTESYKYILN